MEGSDILEESKNPPTATESQTGDLMQTDLRPPAIDVGDPSRQVNNFSYDDDDEISDSDSDEDDSDNDPGVTRLSQSMPRRMSGSRLPSSGPGSPISSMGKVYIDAEILVQIGAILDTFPSPPTHTPVPAEGVAVPPAAKPRKMIGAALSSGVSAAMSGFRGLWT